MYYWRADYFEKIAEAGVQAAAIPEWADYASFCNESGLGLRPKALASLARFIAWAERAPFSERRKFVGWLLLLLDRSDWRRQLAPYPLEVRVIEPTLLEWALVEPDCSEPHRWLGGEEHLTRAIELDPHDQIALRRLVVHILGLVDFATRELPYGYLGSAADDLVALERAEGLLENLSDENDRAVFANEVKLETDLIKEYLRKGNRS